MYRIEPVGPADLPRWQAFVDRSAGAGAFHHAAWHEVLRECFAVRPEYLWALDGEGEVRGVLPMYLSRSRFTGPNLATLEGAALAGSAAAGAALLEAAARRRDELGAGSLVVRGGEAGAPGGRSTRFVHPVVALQGGAEAVWASFQASHRNHVRKASKNGISVCRDETALPDFYRVYARRQRDLGTPVEGARLFDSLRRHFGPRLRLHVARLGGRVVGGMLCVSSVASWSYLYGAADSRHFHRYPNEALFWFTIQEAARAGALRLELGTSAPGSGALRFKEKWTKHLLDVYHHHLDSAAARPRRGSDRFREGRTLAQRAWARLPLALADRLGPILRRQLPFA